jgi:hypothetical protein
MIDSVLEKKANATEEKLLESYNEQLKGKVIQANNWVLKSDLVYDGEVLKAQRLIELCDQWMTENNS